MANWKYQIELNQVINDLSEQYDLECPKEPCPQEVKEALAKELQKAPPLAHYAKKIQKATSIAQVNRILNSVFNTADASLVWCGLY